MRESVCCCRCVMSLCVRSDLPWLYVLERVQRCIKETWLLAFKEVVFLFLSKKIRIRCHQNNNSTNNDKKQQLFKICFRQLHQKIWKRAVLKILILLCVCICVCICVCVFLMYNQLLWSGWTWGLNDNQICSVTEKETEEASLQRGTWQSYTL